MVMEKKLQQMPLNSFSAKQVFVWYELKTKYYKILRET